MFKKFAVIATLALTIGGATATYAQENVNFEACALPQERAEAIAEQLGITAEELIEAYEPGMTIEELAEALDVTVVDLMQIERPFPECPPTGEHIEATAEALGMTVEELRAELEDGKTLYQIAVEQGVDPAEVSRFYSDEALERTAEALGITVEELTASLESGQGVREIAEELGVELPEPGDVQPGEGRPGRPGQGQPGENAPTDVQPGQGRPGEGGQGRPGGRGGRGA